MGLDMFLDAEFYFFCEDREEKTKPIKEMLPEIGDNEVKKVVIGVGYWRKENHIHKWFVDNVQNGDDDCGRHYVERDDLLKLRKVCEKVVKEAKLIEGMVENGYTYEGGEKKSFMEAGKVIENAEVISKLLPTTDGFFFGSTDYNEWYLDGVKETIKIIDKCLNLPETWSLHYHSSW